MSSLTKRIITAAVLVAMTLSVLFLLPPVAAPVFVSIVFLIGCWEWAGFLRGSVWMRCSYLIIGAGLAWLISEWAAGPALSALIYAAVVWWILVTASLILRDIDYGRVEIAAAGLFCLLPAWAALLIILAEPRGPWLVIWLVCIVAAADTGAYFVGKTWGRHKLAPLLSPMAA